MFFVSCTWEWPFDRLLWHVNTLVQLIRFLQNFLLNTVILKYWSSQIFYKGIVFLNYFGNQQCAVEQKFMQISKTNEVVRNLCMQKDQWFMKINILNQKEKLNNLHVYLIYTTLITIMSCVAYLTCKQAKTSASVFLMQEQRSKNAKISWFTGTQSKLLSFLVARWCLLSTWLVLPHKRLLLSRSNHFSNS